MIESTAGKSRVKMVSLSAYAAAGIFANLFLINRWLRSSGALRPRVIRLGELLGAGTLAGYVIVGLGLLLLWMS